MAEKLYPMGTIFRIEQIKKNDALEPEILMYHVILVQLKLNKFALITLHNGNRWSSKRLKGSIDGYVKETDLVNYLKKTNVEEIEVLGHCSTIDYERLPFYNK